MKTTMLQGEMVSHTPTPWRIGDAGHTIFGPKSDQPAPRMIAQMLQCGGNYEERRANAQFIVRAVNCHDDLLEACKVICQMFDDEIFLICGGVDERDKVLKWLRQAARAIAKATTQKRGAK